MAQLVLGLSVGSGVSNISNDFNNLSYTNKVSISGLYIALTTDYAFPENFILKTGFNYSQKGYKIERTGDYEGLNSVFRNTYIQLPVMLSYKIQLNNKVFIFFNAGIYTGYWLSGSTEGNVPNIFSAHTTDNTTKLDIIQYKAPYQFNKIRDNRLENGIIYGIGLDGDITKNSKLRFEVNSYQSFISQRKKYMITDDRIYNRSIVISVGYLVNLKNK